MFLHSSLLYNRLVAVLTALCGLGLLGGGIWLAFLGGSRFYLLSGVALMAIAALQLRRSILTLWLAAATIVVTLVWALWEVGLDWWQLVPRGDVIVVLGILIALPWCAKTLGDASNRRPAWLALATSLVLAIFVAGVSMVVPSNDLSGSLPAHPSTEAATATVNQIPDGDWQAYGRTNLGQRYSPLSQITPENASNLKVAWTYHTGDVRGKNDPTETTYEVTPLKIGNTVYLCTPHDLVIALNAETGAEKWRYDPQIMQPPKNDTQHLTCRGVSYSPDAMPAATANASADCVGRIFLPTVDARLIALSAKTGVVCPGFGGDNGTVDLWNNMPNVLSGSYYSTSPPVVTPTLVVVGGAVNDNVSTTEPSGVIRAFDINTGALVWNWDSRNPTQTAPLAQGQKYSENSPNSWSVSSYDANLGLIYIPMGNQPPDQFGGKRDANVEKFSSSIVALNVITGQVAWVFQATHHDLWDMDIPAQPSLLDLTINGKSVPALVAPTKQGELFVLNRETGVPLLPVVEEPVPQGGAAGDFTSPTQPLSALSFKPQPLTEASMWGATLFDQLACRIKFRSLRYGGRFTPPTEQGSIIYPGNFGALNWGGVAVDPDRQIVFAMPVYLAFTSKLVPRPDPTSRVVTKPGTPPFNENFGAPYAAKMGPFLSPLGFPCQAPPWGYVAGADLTTGKIVYKHVNGTVQDLSPIPLPLKLGVPGIGGPIMTKGGVAFLSGTLDYYVRAYDVTTGKQIWQSRLPAGGQATPMSYWSDASQRQFIVVVAGGHGSTGTQAGDSIIAYALPK
ncbi:MAG: membrane-bound PQQ-dependent dehydrogenase, glucose/quinate/shikimate family [Aestuariivirga sp.]